MYWTLFFTCSGILDDFLPYHSRSVPRRSKLSKHKIKNYAIVIIHTRVGRYDTRTCTCLISSPTKLNHWQRHTTPGIPSQNSYETLFYYYTRWSVCQCLQFFSEQYSGHGVCSEQSSTTSGAKSLTQWHRDCNWSYWLGSLITPALWLHYFQLVLRFVILSRLLSALSYQFTMRWNRCKNSRGTAQEHKIIIRKLKFWQPLGEFRRHWVPILLCNTLSLRWQGQSCGVVVVWAVSRIRSVWFR